MKRILYKNNITFLPVSYVNYKSTSEQHSPQIINEATYIVFDYIVRGSMFTARKTRPILVVPRPSFLIQPLQPNETSKYLWRVFGLTFCIFRRQQCYMCFVHILGILKQCYVHNGFYLVQLFKRCLLIPNVLCSS